jgi:acyl-CoA synthetase (AMP-forming)/AMP-acid ligase II
MTDAVARLRGWAAERPDAALLLTRGRTYTYADVLARASAVAAGLGAAGCGRGRRVALLLEEYDEFFVCMLGVWLAGAVVVPLNTSLPPADVAWLLSKCAPDLLVRPAADAAANGGAGQAGDEGSPRLVVIAGADGRVEGVRPAAEVGVGAGAEEGAAPGAPAGVSASRSPEAADALEPVREDETAMIMFTSGTTGLPKGVCQTLRAVSGNAGHVAAVLGLRPEDRIFINTPPYFTSGICHFLTLLAAGGGLAGQLGFFFGAGLLDEMEAQGCTGFGGAPAHLVRVVEPLEEPREHALRFWVSSGDHLPLHVIEKFRRVLPGVGLFNMYGLTEVSGRLCVLPPAELRTLEGSVGRPIGDMRVVARRGDGAEAAPGESGELYVTGSLLMQGYLDEPEITARTLTAHGLKTGDFGRTDESGAVWIAGRKDDIIKRGGEKVSIVHVQQALQGLGRFADVAVLAAPDEILGHVPVAFVVPHDREGFKASRLLRELRGVLPSSSLPSRVIAVDEIPRTGSGKAIRARLEELLAEDTR